MQTNSNVDYTTKQIYMPIVRRHVLHDVLLGCADPALAVPFLDMLPLQVVLFQPYMADAALDTNAFAEMLHITGQSESCIEIIPIRNEQAFFLRGAAAIRKFHEFTERYWGEENAGNRTIPFFDSIFLACGRVAESAEALPLSYQDARALMQQRFFCTQNQHILRFSDLQNRSSQPSVINSLFLEKYSEKLLQYIQTFNRNLTSSALNELQDILVSGSDSPEAIRLFFADLYLQIKEQMKYLYQGYTIPFYTNSHIIKTILEAPSLNSITSFLAQRFDMIMSSIGASSRESVLDDILHYIQHNYTSNITLENIAPLFGYNHSYLGKIFRKRMGISFNEYIDHLRIKRAKELLLKDNAKVYAVSEQVGYKNVDYFHVKFRKYVRMSPVEFRKKNNGLSNSPDVENSEKGPLFPDT